jgi:hypothetical protein
VVVPRAWSRRRRRTSSARRSHVPVPTRTGGSARHRVRRSLGRRSRVPRHHLIAMATCPGFRPRSRTSSNPNQNHSHAVSSRTGRLMGSHHRRTHGYHKSDPRTHRWPGASARAATGRRTADPTPSRVAPRRMGPSADVRSSSRPLLGVTGGSHQRSRPRADGHAVRS